MAWKQLVSFCEKQGYIEKLNLLKFIKLTAQILDRTLGFYNIEVIFGGAEQFFVTEIWK